MASPVTRQGGFVSERGAIPSAPPWYQTMSASTFSRLTWGMLAPTMHRVRLGEGALLAVNLSLIWYRAPGIVTGMSAAVISVLTLALLYAYNDLYDAPGDRRNPKKDQALVSLYLDERARCYTLTLALKVVTLGVTWLTLGVEVAAAVAGVFLVNIVYSHWMKGVPIVDVLWAGLWGGAYSLIAGPPARLFLVVTLMTAVCHLYQALGDRAADVENRITTTAVFSHALATGLLFVLSGLLFLGLRAPLGTPVALTAFFPFGFWLIVRRSHAGWLLTKLYYGAVWLAVLRYGSAIH